MKRRVGRWRERPTWAGRKTGAKRRGWVVGEEAHRGMCDECVRLGARLVDVLRAGIKVGGKGGGGFVLLFASSAATVRFVVGVVA